MPASGRFLPVGTMFATLSGRVQHRRSCLEIEFLFDRA